MGVRRHTITAPERFEVREEDDQAATVLRLERDEDGVQVLMRWAARPDSILARSRPCVEGDVASIWLPADALAELRAWLNESEGGGDGE